VANHEIKQTQEIIRPRDFNLPASVNMHIPEENGTLWRIFSHEQ